MSHAEAQRAWRITCPVFHRTFTNCLRTGFFLLAMGLGFLSGARPAAADGLVISAVAAGVSGPQIDAAVLSPAARLAPVSASVPRTYVVQRGDTLSAIAARFDTSMAALIAGNGLASPDRVDAGRVLQVDAATVQMPSLPEDSPITRVQFWPWPPTQGQTLAVWLRTRSPITLSLSLSGKTLPVVLEGARAWAIVPISALETPGTRQLTVTIGSTVLVLPVQIRAGSFEVQEIAAEASDPILSQAEKVNTELARMTELFAARSAGGWTPASRFQIPLAPDDAYEHSSPFGSRRTYGDDSALSAHAGEDYAVSSGTPVLAPAAGTVVLAEPLFVRGNAVVLDHGRGVFTGYWHMESLNVKAGERVAAGQVLGKVGSTGLSTGAHLHWEMRVNGVAVDPLQWVEK